MFPHCHQMYRLLATSSDKSGGRQAYALFHSSCLAPCLETCMCKQTEEAEHAVITLLWSDDCSSNSSYIYGFASQCQLPTRRVLTEPWATTLNNTIDTVTALGQDYAVNGCKRDRRCTRKRCLCVRDMQSTQRQCKRDNM